MGSQVKGGLDSDNRKWVITLKTPLKPIYTTITVEKEEQKEEEEEEESDNMEEEYCSTTPKGEEARIPITLTCPPAPKKRKPSLKFNFRREFFTPPDLESVFTRHVERAS